MRYTSTGLIQLYCWACVYAIEHELDFMGNIVVTCAARPVQRYIAPEKSIGLSSVYTHLSSSCHIDLWYVNQYMSRSAISSLNISLIAAWTAGRSGEGDPRNRYTLSLGLTVTPD